MWPVNLPENVDIMTDEMTGGNVPHKSTQICVPVNRQNALQDTRFSDLSAGTRRSRTFATLCVTRTSHRERKVVCTWLVGVSVDIWTLRIWGNM
jgi:hypothetical protein